MLGKPEHGWSLFQLGREAAAYDLSYLTDVPFDWLTHAIHGLETLDVFSVHGYCEPGRVICTVSFWSCYVLFEEDGRSPACQDVRQIPVSMLDFCRTLHRDIAENLDAWAHWRLRGENSAREANLKDKRNRLAQLIEEKKTAFDESHCFI